jgi:predicted ATP-dependent endonuclease of OLD family
MKFKSLKISNWKQFHAIDIEFHKKLTVLTGSNASGKTTLLNLLGRHFGWDFPELTLDFSLLSYAPLGYAN